MRWNCRVPVGMHGGVRGRLSICENILFDCGIRQALQNLPNICIDADGLQLNFLWANCLPLVDADVGGVWVLGCHLPERVFDDNGRIVPNAQFQKEDFLPCAGPEKVFIPFRCSVPAFVLHEGIIAAQVQGQRLPAVGTGRKKLGRYFHILLPLDHLPNDLLIIKGLLTARLTALEQTIIALRVEQALFIKASFLKAVVNIRGDDKIIFVLYQLQKINTAYKKRIVCAFIDDIYMISDLITQQDDIKVIEIKDYIKNPKSNGYRSYHMIVEIPVFFAKGKTPMRVELQIRTNGMDFWATLEHQLRYKKGIEEMPGYDEISEELLHSAKAIIEADNEMQRIKDKIGMFHEI